MNHLFIGFQIYYNIFGQFQLIRNVIQFLQMDRDLIIIEKNTQVHLLQMDLD